MWRSVKEKPKTDEIILVGWYNQPGRWVNSLGYYQKNGMWVNLYLSEIHPSHWMEIPASPKAGDHSGFEDTVGG